MNYNDRNIQKFFLLRKTSIIKGADLYSPIALAFIITILVGLYSGSVKSDTAKPFRQLESQSGEVNSIENYKENPIKAENTYSFENKKAWLELKKRLSNDLMSAKELGIIDCRNFESNSINIKPRLTQEVRYIILGAGYSWYIYQINNDLCIKIGVFDELSTTRPKPIPFFLNIEDTRFLLSASKSYHFKKLDLEQSIILSKITYFRKDPETLCDSTTTKFLEGKVVSSNNCYEEIYYK